MQCKHKCLFICNMKLTIIIPVYQVKDTLRRCVDSVLRQDFRDWQLILVDDASTDGSGDICDEYRKDNQRIQVVHLSENSGLSAARNAGLDKAKGEYLTFIDSDDYIAPDTLKQLMEEIAIHPDYDILEYPVYEHFGSKEQRLLQFHKREYHDMKDYWLEGKAYRHTYAWNKIYRHDIFRGIRFPEGRTFEDVATLPHLLNKCNIIATTDVGLYYYCSNTNGITHTASVTDYGNLLDANLSVLNKLYPRPSHRNFPKRLDKDFADYYAHVLNVLLDVTDNSGKEDIDIKIKAFPILPYRQTAKLKAMHLISLKNLCLLHRIFRKIHKPER